MPTNQFHIYTLPTVLPEGHVLVLNTHSFSLSTFIISQLSAESYGLVAQELVTEHEMYALSALLEAYPDYCTYDILHAAINDEMINQAQAIVHQAVDDKTLDQSMKPVRNILSRCRAKLRTFNIDIRSVHGEGYYLAALE